MTRSSQQLLPLAWELIKQIIKLHVIAPGLLAILLTLYSKNDNLKTDLQPCTPYSKLFMYSSKLYIFAVFKIFYLCIMQVLEQTKFQVVNSHESVYEKVAEG